MVNKVQKKNLIQEEYLKTGEALLDKETFNLFLNDELTVKEAKSFSEKINARFNYVVHKIAEITGRNIEWFDYDNENQNTKYSNTFNGLFDTHRYATEVSYIGQFFNTKNSRFNKYDDYFPTNWLVETFESNLTIEMLEHIELEKNKQLEIKLANENQLNVLAKIKGSIESKLTPEELCFVNFVKANEVTKNLNALKKKKNDLISKKVKELKELNIDVKKLYTDYKIVHQENSLNFLDWVNENLENLKPKKPKI